MANFSDAMGNATGGGVHGSFTAKFITAGNAVQPAAARRRLGRRLLLATTEAEEAAAAMADQVLQTSPSSSSSSSSETHAGGWGHGLRRLLQNASAAPVPYAVLRVRSTHATPTAANAAAAALSTAGAYHSLTIVHSLHQSSTQLFYLLLPLNRPRLLPRLNRKSCE